jgi:hypothetical protein
LELPSAALRMSCIAGAMFCAVIVSPFLVVSFPAATLHHPVHSVADATDHQPYRPRTHERPRRRVDVGRRQGQSGLGEGSCCQWQQNKGRRCGICRPIRQTSTRSRWPTVRSRRSYANAPNAPKTPLLGGADNLYKTRSHSLCQLLRSRRICNMTGIRSRLRRDVAQRKRAAYQHRKASAKEGHFDPNTFANGTQDRSMPRCPRTANTY